MIGLKEKSIVISLDEAKEYSKSRLIVLNQQKDRLLNELDKIDIDINMEMEKLAMMDNSPKDEIESERIHIKIPVSNILNLIE